MNVLDQLKKYINKPFSNNPSPMGKWLQGILREADIGTITFEFVVRNEMTNPLHILHGGATAAIIDDTIGMTAATLGHEEYFVTINLSIDYLASAKEGDVITAKSSTVREGKNILHIECRLLDAEGKLLAKGTSNLLKTNILRIVSN